MMKRIDNQEIPDVKEVRLVVAGFNAEARINDFIKHYKNIGVDRIFYIDNNSTDNSIDVLKQHPDVHVWLQEEKYGDKNKFGVKWMEEILKQYGVGNWCLTVDVDELFVFPDCENTSIKEFIKEQETKGFDSVKAMFIDMYSNKPLIETKLEPDKSLIETCNYFDVKYPGIRYRVMEMGCWMQKQPLLYFRENTVLTPGMHYIFNSKTPSNIYCCLMHLKFFDDFIDYVNKVKENLNENDIQGYLTIDENTNFYNSKYSINYIGTRQLIQLGLMSNAEGTNELQEKLIKKGAVIDNFFEK